MNASSPEQVGSAEMKGNPMRSIALLLASVVITSTAALTTIFDSVRGIVHDPQHRPIQGAMVMLKATSSDWAKNATTDANGEFLLNAVPIGNYSINAANPGFTRTAQNVIVNSGTEPAVHFQMQVAGAKETISVSDAPVVAPTDSATPITLVSRLDIGRTPAPHPNADDFGCTSSNSGLDRRRSSMSWRVASLRTTHA